MSQTQRVLGCGQSTCEQQRPSKITMSGVNKRKQAAAVRARARLEERQRQAVKAAVARLGRPLSVLEEVRVRRDAQ